MGIVGREHTSRRRDWSNDLVSLFELQNFKRCYLLNTVMSGVFDDNEHIIGPTYIL